MPTQRNTKSLEFEPHGRRRVVADFDGGPITSDAGALLLRRVDRHLSLSDQVADCFTDHRDPRRVRHSLRKLISQRIVGIALGYEDLIDHDQLRHDPLMALFSEKGRKDSPSEQDSYPSKVQESSMAVCISIQSASSGAVANHRGNPVSFLFASCQAFSRTRPSTGRRIEG